MKFSAFLLFVSCFIIAGSSAAAPDGDATTEECSEPKASERHEHLRKLQPQSCAKGSSSLVGNGQVPLVALRASVEFSAHICFDDDSGVAVGDFFDSSSEDWYVTYHVHCAARDNKGGIYFGAEVDYMSKKLMADAANPPRDDMTTERKLAKGGTSKSTKAPKSTKSPKGASCGCDACNAVDNDIPLCKGDDGFPGIVSCCDCTKRKLQEDTGIVIQHANGEAKKNRELSSNSPQGTLALLYFGTNGEGKEGKTTDTFGLHLFADFDHSCESFAEQMKDFNMDEDIEPFQSGGFSIHRFRDAHH